MRAKSRVRCPELAQTHTQRLAESKPLPSTLAQAFVNEVSQYNSLWDNTYPVRGWQSAAGAGARIPALGATQHTAKPDEGKCPQKSRAVRVAAVF